MDNESRIAIASELQNLDPAIIETEQALTELAECANRLRAILLGLRLSRSRLGAVTSATPTA